MLHVVAIILRRLIDKGDINGDWLYLVCSVVLVRQRPRWACSSLGGISNSGHDRSLPRDACQDSNINVSMCRALGHGNTYCKVCGFGRKPALHSILIWGLCMMVGHTHDVMTWQGCSQVSEVLGQCGMSH